MRSGCVWNRRFRGGIPRTGDRSGYLPRRGRGHSGASKYHGERVQHLGAHNFLSRYPLSKLIRRVDLRLDDTLDEARRDAVHHRDRPPLSPSQRRSLEPRKPPQCCIREAVRPPSPPLFLLGSRLTPIIQQHPMESPLRRLRPLVLRCRRPQSGPGSFDLRTTTAPPTSVGVHLAIPEREVWVAGGGREEAGSD